MFFLLLFFLIISTLANPSILKLTTPGKTTTIENKSKIVLKVDANHQYIVNNLPIAFTDLENALRVEMNRTQSSSIILAFNNTLSIQDLADVMQIGYGLDAKMVLQASASKQ
ncbi:biopolymer transporter ExbD [soil metagenome]